MWAVFPQASKSAGFKVGLYSQWGALVRDWKVLVMQKTGVFFSLSALESISLVTVSFARFQGILGFVGPWALITPPSPFVSQPKDANGFLLLLVSRSPHCPHLASLCSHHLYN